MNCSTQFKIAVKDKESKYVTKDISIFELKEINNYIPSMKIRVVKQKEIITTVQCPICGNNHENKYLLNDLLKRQMLIGGCDNTGLPIYFIGKPIIVNKYIIKYNEINRKAYAMF